MKVFCLCLAACSVGELTAPDPGARRAKDLRQGETSSGAATDGSGEYTDEFGNTFPKVQPESVQTPSMFAPAVDTRRGVWVYSPGNWIDEEAKIREFEAYLDKHRINEVYLSTNYGLLASEHLPPFIARMTARGVVVEALIGKPEWAYAAGRPDMLLQLGKISLYNADHPVSERYSAVHVDIEPWMGTGNDMSWVAPLITTYRTAKNALGIPLVADMAGAKAMHVSLAQRQAMVDILDRIAIMQYEVPLAEAVSRTNRFAQGVSFAQGQGAVLAMRAVDFPENYVASTLALDSSLKGTSGYLGWAHYHYGDM